MSDFILIAGISFVATACFMANASVASADETGCTPPPLCCEDVTGSVEGVSDRMVGINDFLAILANWGVGGAVRPFADIMPLSCDGCAAGGDNEVGIDDFLAVLSAWGPCDSPIDECVDVLDPANGYARLTGDGAVPYKLNGVLDGPSRPATNEVQVILAGPTSCGWTDYGVGVIPGGFQFGDTFGIDASTGETSGDNWLLYTASCSGRLTLNTLPPDCSLPGLSAITMVETYPGGVCPTSWLDVVGCAQFNTGFCIPGLPHSILNVNVLEAEEVLIRVGGWAGFSGEGTLTYSCVDNSTCDRAIALPIGDSITMTTVGATNAGSPICDGVEQLAPGRWFTVIGDCKTLTASTCGSQLTYNTRISVYTSLDGTCNTLNCVAAADDHTCDLDESVSWCSVFGQVYYILVHGEPDVLPPFVPTGEFTLSVTSDGTECAVAPCGG